MAHLWTLILGAALGTGLLATAPANAQPMTPEQQGLYLIDRTGATRMLTQRLLRRSCYIAVQADIADAVAIDGDLATFDETLTMVMDGDEALGIPATRAPRVQRRAKMAKDTFMAYSGFAKFATRGDMPMAYLNAMADARVEMLATEEALVKSVVRTFGLGRLDPFTTETVNAIAKLRMLANLIAVEHCLLAAGANGASEEALYGALQAFETQLQLTRRGDDARRVLAPSAELDAMLVCTQDRLAAVRAIIGQNEISAATVIRLRPATSELERAADDALHIIERELAGLSLGMSSNCGQS